MIKDAKRIVLKVGSALVADERAGLVREAWVSAFAADVAALVRQGKQVIIVTSGAIALGRMQLKMKPKARLVLEEKQAAAAVGQIALFAAWREAFAAHDLVAAQLLLTADDSIQRQRYLNARATLETLLEHHAVPIINENDTVATSEIRFGDNDRLAARVAQMAEAEMLVLFSDIDGLYDADPSKYPNARFIPVVEQITPEIEKMAGGVNSAVGSGGMVTKIAAAKIACAAGCHLVIASGKGERPLAALMQGGRHSLFKAEGSPRAARKNWIAGSMHPRGRVVVDDGAARALASGSSLLPAGVKDVSGEFERGDTVEIVQPDGRVLGRGLIAYASSDTRLILGKQSEEIEQILGFKRKDVLIHRDDMVLE
ncbi:MAG: glutamate 5-kinase [Alphaproteobacteria bacterium]|nr:glutamate 5-kinase [Alphaproteobacteria bacterium]